MYKVSWIDSEGFEWFSENMSKENAYQLFEEITYNKVDNEQVKCNLYFLNSIIKFSYNK